MNFAGAFREFDEMTSKKIGVVAASSANALKTHVSTDRTKASLPGRR